MSFEPSKFELSRPPLAVVLAQFSLRNPILKPTVDLMRKSLKPIGLVRLTSKHERLMSISPGSLNPTVQDSQIWFLLDSGNTKGLSVAGNMLSCFTGAHSGFTEFVGYLSKIVDSISSEGRVFESTSIALRYINVFDIGDDPTSVVESSLGGLNRTNLGKEHHHHNYEFWCDTEYGRLTVRFSTTHGDRKPAQIGFAEAVFPPDRLRSYDDSVGHLDIFANTRTLNPAVDWKASMQILQVMNANIEQAFLNAVNQTALVDRFGAKAK